MLLAIVVGVMSGGCHLVEEAEAATRSTRQFRASPIDPRVSYEPGAERLAGVVAGALPAAVETVERRQYGAFDVPIRVYVCATVDSFAKYAMSRRAAGHTIAHRVFVSPKPENTDERIPRILTHELSHLHLGQKRSTLSFARLPTWFVEGLAVEVSGGGGAEGVSDEELRRTISEGHTFVPETDESLLHPRGASSYGLDAHLFYGQAGLFVGDLRSLDERRFQALLRDVEEGVGLGPAFAAAYGLSMQDAWRRFLARAATPSGCVPSGQASDGP